MNETVGRLIDDLTMLARETQETFGARTPEDLAWPPGPGEWSAAECLQHLILINSSYFPVFEEIARGGYRPPLWARVPVLPRLFAPLLIKAVSPEGPRKLKAQSRFTPPSASALALARDVVARFLGHQRELIERMKRTEGIDPTRVVIRSPVAGFVTYSLLDAFRVIVAHERRHLAQARRAVTFAARGVNPRPLLSWGADKAPPGPPLRS